MLTVSIVTFHTPADELRRCLASLTDDVVDRVFIIDNSSDEGVRRVCEQWGDRRVEYRPNPNTGYGAAHNLALRRVVDEGLAPYHLVLNSDVSFAPGVLRRLVEVMERMPGVGQLQPEVVNPDGTPQYTVRRLPAPIDVIGRRFLPAALTRRRNARYELHHLDHTRPFNVAYHQGSFMLLRSEALRRTGFFDERFFMYPEDIDLTRRINARWVTLYWPGERVVHDHRAASYKSWRMTWIHIVNMIRYFNKWGWIIDRGRRRINRRLDRGLTYID